MDACVCRSIFLSLKGNNSVEKFPRRQRFFGGVVFWLFHVISKESWRIILSRTACLKSQLCSHFYKYYSFVILYMSRHTGFIMASCSVFMLNVLTFVLHPMFLCLSYYLCDIHRSTKEVENEADV
jgi:hypothetical protein